VFCASTLAFAEWSKEDYALDDARIGAFNDAWYLFMDGRRTAALGNGGVSLKHLFSQSIIETPCRSCDVRDNDFAICSATEGSFLDTATGYFQITTKMF
jgi:hypothetical protein